MPTTGKLIVFEGTDGTGKSTQLQLLGHYLTKAGYPVVLTKEPTDGQYGKQIRELYNHRENFSPEEELQLFLADRREHVTHFLLPLLQQGKIILCDRYYFSTVAYQGALGFNLENLFKLNDFAPPPDLVLLFQAPLTTSLTRITAGRGDTLNKFEQLQFLEKVAAIFSAMDLPYIRRINASESIANVQNMVIECVTELLPPLPLPPTLDI